MCKEEIIICLHCLRRCFWIKTGPTLQNALTFLLFEILCQYPLFLLARPLCQYPLLLACCDKSQKHLKLDLCAKHTHAPTQAPFLTKAWLMNSTICLKWEFVWNMFITKRTGIQQDNRSDLLSIMCSISKAMATSQHWFSIKCQCIYPLFEITSEAK